MKKFISLLLAFSCLFLVACDNQNTNKTEKQKFSVYYFDYFDTETTIVGYEETKENFDANCTEIKALLEEYHKLYDIYTVYNGVNNLATVNKVVDGEHEIVSVDKKIIDMLLFAKEMYSKTDGKVNVAMGSVLLIWHRYRTKGEKNPLKAELPPMEKLQEAANHTDINNVIIDTENSTVYLADPEMTLDVGAIAKGYAVEKIAQTLEEKGVTGYILNVGGNVRTIGTRGDNTPWLIGVENPGIENGEAHIAYLNLSGEALVTSGSYQRYYTVDGVDYHHIIDPQTLMPGTNFKSVSILCKDSGLGDALSTAVFTMSYEEGYALIESIDGVEAMWVLPNGEKKFSKGFQNYTYENEK